MLFLSESREQCATYCGPIERAGKSSILAGGTIPRSPSGLPLASVANARFFVARSVSA